MKYASLKLCAKNDQCDAKNESSSFESSTCRAVGGDEDLAVKICGQDAGNEDVESWLSGGSLDSGSSAYRFKFMALSDFVSALEIDDYNEISSTLEKAVEYNSCRMGQNPPVEEWDDDSGCKCVRQCENGGVQQLPHGPKSSRRGMG